MVFASVASLGKKEYLNERYFASDYFDYIIIDEFRHAAAKQYQWIINYFKPRFLLGLTATPERMDGKNIYALCDLFTDMADEVYQYCRAHGSMNPCRNYLVYLQQQGD